MTHEEIIKREDGTQYKIIAFWRFGIVVGVYKLQGHIWKPCTESNVTPEEIYTAKLTLWEQMKPEL